VAARIVVRDENHAATREAATAGSRAGWSGGRFEVEGLRPGTYLLEISAPDHCWTIRFGVAVDAACDTHIGTVRLARSLAPGTLAASAAEPARFLTALATAASQHDARPFETSGGDPRASARRAREARRPVRPVLGRDDLHNDASVAPARPKPSPTSQMASE